MQQEKSKLDRSRDRSPERDVGPAAVFDGLDGGQLVEVSVGDLRHRLPVGRSVGGEGWMGRVSVVDLNK